MTPPSTIPLSSITLGERIRKTYNRVDELAESISQKGLLCPLVLVATPDGPTPWKLNMGGRRWHALQLLDVDELTHAAIGLRDPLRPGYLLKGESDPLADLVSEIGENLDREDVDWRDNVRALVKAWTIAKARADLETETLLMRDYGSMLGVGYANLQAAVFIHDDLQANPERYKDVVSIRGAQSVLLKVNANALAKLAAEQALTEVPVLSTEGVELPKVSAQIEPRLDPFGGERTQDIAIVTAVPHEVIPLSTSFINRNGLDFMEACEPGIFDHIVTDPDYAVDVDLLNSGTGTSPGIMAAAVRQSTIEESLADLYRFLRLAFKVTKPLGWCVFWYDIQHHEKLQRAAVEAGWLPQRWPLTWRKLDYRSNAAPSHNTCKNEEWAMMLRKPNGVLVKAQMSSIYDAMSGKVTKELGHAFAKPYELWRWIYSMIAIKGQVVFDPFVGSGSAAIAALQWGLRPTGCELDETIYHNLLCNLQIHYKKELGQHITFK